MREIRSSGSVRGASGDGCPYRERFLLISARLGEGRLTSRQRSLSISHGDWLPTAFADRLRGQSRGGFCRGAR